MSQEAFKETVRRIREAANAGAGHFDLTRLHLDSFPDELWQLQSLVLLELHGSR